jgi:hypothetical protein
MEEWRDEVLAQDLIGDHLRFVFMTAGPDRLPRLCPGKGSEPRANALGPRVPRSSTLDRGLVEVSVVFGPGSTTVHELV